MKITLCGSIKFMDQMQAIIDPVIINGDLSLIN